MARQEPPPRDNEAERAHRILDVATDLLLRQGCDEVTIEEVARGAGFAPATVHLYWEDWEDLLAALLRRECVYLMEEVRSREPTTLGELLGEFVGTALRRPLLRTVLAGESEVLGRVARTRLGGPEPGRIEGEPGCSPGLEVGGAAKTYLRRLIEHGAVHTEHTEHAWVITAIVRGFVLLPERLYQDARPPDRRLTALVADTVERALGTGRVVPGTDAVARATLDFLDALEEIARHRLAACLHVKKR